MAPKTARTFSCLTWNSCVQYPSKECKLDLKEPSDIMFNPIFLEKVPTCPTEMNKTRDNYEYWLISGSGAGQDSSGMGQVSRHAETERGGGAGKGERWECSSCKMCGLHYCAIIKHLLHDTIHQTSRGESTAAGLTADQLQPLTPWVIMVA